MASVSNWLLQRTSIAGGRYRGWLTGEGEPPALGMYLGEDYLGPLTKTPEDGGFRIDGALSAALLTQGVQTVSIRTADGDLMDSVTVVTGLETPHDLRAEMDALRAELTVLKAAFRRHVIGTDLD